MSSLLWRASKTAALAALASLTVQTAAFGQTATDAEVKRLTAEKAAVGSQLAIVSKTLGDEQFIDGDRQAARRSYAIAAGAALQAMIDPTLLTQADTESLSLLQRDIDYRTVLIDADLPFWGLEFTSSADIPVLRMTELEALSTKLGSLNTDIQKLVDRLRSLDLQQLKAESESRRQEVQADISQLEQTQGEVNTEFHAKARADAYGRVTRLQVLVDELVQQQREAEQGIKAIEKKNQQCKWRSKREPEGGREGSQS